VYSTCLYCHTELGRNESVEHFPVGRRIAFDVANGRLWVICASCKRWNLTPVEERWEAIEECERLFERTRLRMSTDNIGLARVAEGTELVRVGAALRPEMAAWRFGAQLAARRRQYRLVVVGGVVLSAGLYVGVKAAGLGIVAGNWGWGLVKAAYERATRIVLPEPEQRRLDRSRDAGDLVAVLSAARTASRLPRIETKHAQAARLQYADDRAGLIVSVPTVGSEIARYGADLTPRVLGKLLAKVNRSGGRRVDERLAVQMLESVAGAGVDALPRAVVDKYLHRTLVDERKSAERQIGKWGASTMLALEMALQEQRERELLAGELLDLEVAWREAEELARIADTLTPSHIDRALARLKARLDG
jgi:hypothetical protein